MNKIQIIAILIVILSVSIYCGLILTQEESPKTDMIGFRNTETGELVSCMYIQGNIMVITTELDECNLGD